MSSRRPLLFALLASLFLSGCAGWNMYLNPVRLRVRAAGLVAATPTALTVAIDLAVYNPNGLPLDRAELRLVAESAGHVVARGEAAIPVAIAPRRTGTVRARVDLRPGAAAPGPLLVRGEARFPTSAGLLTERFEAKM